MMAPPFAYIDIMSARILRIILAAAAILLIAVAFGYQYGWFGTGDRRPGSTGIAKIGGPFTLVDHKGSERRDSDFKGSLMLIYFGYTYCPDVCPTALQVMSVAMDVLGRDGRAVQPILITIDPERDTVAHLAKYVTNFHPRLVGLTGSVEAVNAAARGYRVYFAKSKPEGEKPASATDYLMDHTSIVYLMDRKGLYLTHFTHNTDSGAMAVAIRKHLQ